MRKERDLSQDAVIRNGERFAYGFGGAFANGAVNLFVMGFLLIFYTEIMHVNAGVAATVIGISKALDGIGDLVVGRIIDKTHSKFGKTRIWMLRVMPVTIISLFAIYLMPSNMPQHMQIIYIFITYNIASAIGYTFMNVSFMALNGLMTRDQKSRGLNAGVNMIGNVVVGLIGNTTIITLLHLFSKNKDYSAYGDRQGWLILLSIYMVVYVIFELICVFGTRERVKDNEHISENQEIKKTDIPFSVTLKALFTNKYWVINIIICICIYFLMGATGSTTSLYMTYVVGSASFFQVISLVSTIAMLIALLAGFTIMLKIGKRNTVLMGFVVVFTGLLMPAISSDKVILIIGAAFAGLGNGIAGCAFASIVQDTLTYGEWKNGFGMIGMGNAANSFCTKIGNSLGTIVLGWVMSISGYVPGLAKQPESALIGFRLMYIWLPVIFILISATAAFFYDLDKNYQSIVEDLKVGKYAPGVKPYHKEEENS